MGGVPTTINKIRAYITLRSARKDLYKDMTVLKQLDNDFCWVLIFLLLRSGHAREALEYVNERATAFRAIDRNFPTYLAAYYRSPDRRLPREMQSRIAAEYNQSTRVAPENSQDPYRMACYKVVGRCDLSRRHLEPLEQGVEDWMWLQFALAREVNRADEIAAEVFGLDEVRGVIREIGQRHFSKGQADNPGGHGTFFFLQILGGLFEEAVAYLYPYSYVSTVHFAIGLAFYGLLRVSGSPLADSELRE
jgi:nuclear pore complex protein Nup93